MRDAVLYGEKALNLDAWCVQDVKVREAEGERVQNRDAEHNDHIQTPLVEVLETTKPRSGPKNGEAPGRILVRA